MVSSPDAPAWMRGRCRRPAPGGWRITAEIERPGCRYHTPDMGDDSGPGALETQKGFDTTRPLTWAFVGSLGLLLAAACGLSATMETRRRSRPAQRRTEAEARHGRVRV
jgi:hypothetical protein